MTQTHWGTGQNQPDEIKNGAVKMQPGLQARAGLYKVVLPLFNLTLQTSLAAHIDYNNFATDSIVDSSFDGYVFDVLASKTVIMALWA